MIILDVDFDKIYKDVLNALVPKIDDGGDAADVISSVLYNIATAVSVKAIELYHEQMKQA